MNIKDLTFNQKIGLLKTLNETYATYGYGDSLSGTAKKLSHSVLNSFEDTTQITEQTFTVEDKGQLRDLLIEFSEHTRDSCEMYPEYIDTFIKKKQEKMYSKDDIIAILPKMRDNWIPKQETIVDSFTQYIKENL